MSKPDFVFDHNLSHDDIFVIVPCFIRVPANFGTKSLLNRLRYAFSYQSAVAAGRIARFILTRLCCSQEMSIHFLFQVSFSEINPINRN